MALDQETFALLKDSVRRFVQERLVPNEDRVEHDDEVPAEIIAEMKELGPVRPVDTRRVTVASAFP